MLPLFDFVKDIATIAGVALDQAVLDDLRDLLDTDAGRVADRPMDVKPQWFGGAHTGSYRLGTNTSKAHETLIEAFREMQQGLESYSEAIHLYAEDLRNTDDAAAATSKALQAAAQQVDADFGAEGHR